MQTVLVNWAGEVQEGLSPPKGSVGARHLRGQNWGICRDLAQPQGFLASVRRGGVMLLQLQVRKAAGGASGAVPAAGRLGLLKAGSSLLLHAAFPPSPFHAGGRVRMCLRHSALTAATSTNSAENVMLGPYVSRGACPIWSRAGNKTNCCQSNTELLYLPG